MCSLQKRLFRYSLYWIREFFFNIQKHNHPKSFAEIEKTKIEARLKNESERSTLAPRDIYKKIINPENVDSTFTKISSIMSKRRASNILPIPRRVEEFIIWWKTLISGQLMAICFTEHSLPANEDLALIFLADFDLSFLNRIHSIHVDATFKTVPVDFYQLLIIHCLVVDTIIPVFYFLMSCETRLLHDAVFLQIRSLAP